MVLADPARAAEKTDQGSSEFELQGYTRIYLPHTHKAIQTVWCTANLGLEPAVQALYVQFICRVTPGQARVCQDHVTRCTSNCKNFKPLSQRKYLLTSHLICNFHENLKTSNSCTLTLKLVISVPGSFLVGIL